MAWQLCVRSRCWNASSWYEPLARGSSTAISFPPLYRRTEPDASHPRLSRRVERPALAQEEVSQRLSPPAKGRERDRDAGAVGGPRRASAYSAESDEEVTGSAVPRREQAGLPGAPGCVRFLSASCDASE